MPLWSHGPIHQGVLTRRPFDPVLPGEKRSHRNVARTDQIRVQGVRSACALPIQALLVAADEQQAFVRAVALVRVAAQGTSLTGVVWVYHDGK